MASNELLLQEIRSLKSSYVHNGGNDTKLLAQIEEAEKKAISLSSTKLDTSYIPGSELRVQQEKCNDELRELERMLEKLEERNKMEKLRRTLKVDHEKNYDRRPDVPSWAPCRRSSLLCDPVRSDHIDDSGRYDSLSGFTILYDFIIGLPNDVRVIQLYAGLRDGTGVYYQPSKLPPVYTETDNPSVVTLGVRQPVERCPLGPGMCVIIELQTSVVGRSVRLESCAWSKLVLVDSHFTDRLLAGRWRIPFRHLPIDSPGEDTATAEQFGQVELCVRVVHSRDADYQLLSKFSPMELSRYRLQLSVTPVKETRIQLTPELRHSSRLSNTSQRWTRQAPTQTIRFQVSRIKNAAPGECMVRLTVYSRSTGHVALCSAGPVTCVTTAVLDNVLHNRHVFGQPEATFPDVAMEENLVIVVRTYLRTRHTNDDSLFHFLPSPDVTADNSDHVEETSRSNAAKNEGPAMLGKTAMEDFTLVAWTSLPLVIRDMDQVHCNTGTHVLPLYCPPVPDVNLMVGDLTSRDLCNRCGHSSIKLQINVGQPRRGSLGISDSDSEDDNDEDNGINQEPNWLLNKRQHPLSEPFQTTDGFDLFIDGCRHLPDMVTITRVAARVMDQHYTKFGHDMNAISRPDSSVYNPVYAFHAEFHEPNLPPTATLLFKLYTVDRFLETLVIIGYAVLNVFVETGNDKQPITDTGVQISLNEGGHQLRFYHEVPDGSRPLSESCLQGKRAIPCASLLVRLVKAPAVPTVQSKHESPSWNSTSQDESIPSLSLPKYSTGVYYSDKCVPSAGELELFRTLAARPSVTVHETALQLCKDRPDVGTDIENFIRMKLNRLLDKIPDDMDLTLISPYQLRHGIKVAIDSAVNLPWSNFTHAHFCLSPPGAFYLGKTRKVHDKLTFTRKLDVNSTNHSPAWIDGFTHFRHRLYNPHLALIIHLKEIAATKSSDGLKYSLLKQGWTAVQVFNSDYVCTGYYQLPLILGCPTVKDLEQLSVQPVKEWMVTRLKAGQIQLIDRASVMIRLCDGRRDSELSSHTANINSQITVDTSYLPTDKLSTYAKQSDGLPLSNLIPDGNNADELIEKLGRRFKNFVYRIFHNGELAADQQLAAS